MRVVLDVNVLLSGLFWRGAPHECLLAAEAQLYDLILAEEILQELLDKLIGKFGVPMHEAEQTVARIRSRATLAALQGKSGWVDADPDDDKFVEAAIVGDADLIVSGDRDLLRLNTVEGIEILSPGEFLNRLLSEGEGE